MKFPYFATTVLITIVCFMLFVKSLDYGKTWAIALSVVGMLTFSILSLIAILYQMRKHEGNSNGSHH